MRPATRLTWMILAFALAGCGRSQASQDRLDQAALRRLFVLPRGAAVVEFDGYPSRVGFGQREGLSLSAAYRLDAGQAQAFLESAEGSGWEPLPIAAGLLDRIPFQQLEVPKNLTDGFYLCRTAGDNVLYAEETRSCAETLDFHDLILGVYDRRAQQVWVTVRSAY